MPVIRKASSQFAAKRALACLAVNLADANGSIQPSHFSFPAMAGISTSPFSHDPVGNAFPRRVLP
jgi:hypothetical protein